MVTVVSKEEKGFFLAVQVEGDSESLRSLSLLMHAPPLVKSRVYELMCTPEIRRTSLPRPLSTFFTSMQRQDPLTGSVEAWLF